MLASTEPCFSIRLEFADVRAGDESFRFFPERITTPLGGSIDNRSTICDELFERGVIERVDRRVGTVERKDHDAVDLGFRLSSWRIAVLRTWSASSVCKVGQL